MNELINSQPQTLAEVPELILWLANFVSKQTQDTYGRSVVEFARHFRLTQPEDFQSITRAHVIAWRNHLTEQGASERTVNNKLSALSSLFKHLCDAQNIARNPVDGVKRPKVRQDEVKTAVLTVAQVHQLLKAPNNSTLKGLRDSAVLHLLCYTGCRISEVCSLKVKDLLEDGGYQVLEFTVKGGKQNRLAIHPELVCVIKDYLCFAPHAFDREAPMICGVRKHQQNKKLTRRQIDRIFHHYAKVVGLPIGVTPHSARATFITEALENQCPMEAVQRSVGHAKISTTQMYDKRGKKHKDSASFVVKY